MQSMLAMVLLLLSTSYADATSRQIKALSPEEVRSLHEGKGMGMALPAELNHYPGPMHVLELQDRLELTAEQKAVVQAAHDRMKASARALGAEIVDLERELDQAFAQATIDEKRLGDLTAAIAERQGRLRFAHLAAHLATRSVLSEAQVRAYDAARGYGSAPPQHSPHGH